MPEQQRQEPRSRWARDLLLGEIIPRWTEAAGMGLFRCAFDRRWTAASDQTATVVSQSRLVYVFAEASRLTGQQRYRDLVSGGADALIATFRDGSGWAWSCDAEGRIVDDRRRIYGYAFVIFGLAHAYERTKEPRYRELALRTLREAERLRDREYGYFDATMPDFSPADGAGRRQNPIMHLVEALLTLLDVESEDAPGGTTPRQPTLDRDAISRHAGFWIQFLRNRAIRLPTARGPSVPVFPELYDESWSPTEENTPNPVSVGHLFEWAYLLLWAESHGVTAPEGADLLSQATGLLDVGLALGFDGARGGVYSRLSFSGDVLPHPKVYWDQCELIRAADAAERLGVRRFNERLVQTIAFFDRSFHDHDFGGVYITAQTDGTPDDTRKGTIWKVDYHVTAMCSALMNSRFA